MYAVSNRLSLRLYLKMGPLVSGPEGHCPFPSHPSLHHKIISAQSFPKVRIRVNAFMHFLSVRKLEVIFTFSALLHISSVVWWTCPVSCRIFVVLNYYQNIKSNVKTALVLCAIFIIWVSYFNIHLFIFDQYP